MFTKATNILKRQVHPYVLLAAGLVVVALVTVLTGAWQHEYELSHQQKVSGTPAIAVQAAPAAGAVAVEQQPTASPADNPQAFASSGGNASNRQVQSAVSPTAPTASSPQSQDPVPPATLAVSLSVNGVLKGTVTVPSGSTQCAVLQAAYDSGVIASLDMRYNSQYKTFAVYVVDGIGDPGAIWWTYTVNGKSPPYGCSGTKAIEGDSVNWKYVKQ